MIGCRACHDVAGDGWCEYHERTLRPLIDQRGRVDRARGVFRPIGLHPATPGSAGLLELASAHAYAADFGTVLEWCTGRTESLFRAST